jgi:NAD(P)-dependent dehydrogenase (short-subunit alcohol dehydrogenase family)
MAYLTGRVAIVTGASSGIGRAIAEAFGAEGARLVLASRGLDRLNTLAETLRSRGSEVVAEAVDVATETEVALLFNRTQEVFGRVDILVNNAGTTARTPTDEMTLAEWQRVIDVNLTGAFLCAREALRMMKRQGGGGRIINIGSVSAKVPRANSAPYTTSKFALEGLTRSLALDGRPFGIAASILHPGNTTSGFWVGREEAASQEGVMNPADVARVAVVMASLPPDVNLLEGVMLPVSMPFLGRG